MLFVFVAMGCNADPIPLEEFTTRMAEATCSWEVRCQEIPNRETCAEGNLRGLVDADYQPMYAAIEAGRAVYDGDAARECIEAVEALGCEHEVSDKAACRGALRGQIPEGDACYFNGECRTGDCVLPASCKDSCCMGLCGRGSAAVDEACSDAISCVEGAYCDRTSSTCRPRKVEGSPCDSDSSCQPHMYCDDDAPDPAVCRRLPYEGELCPDYDCALRNNDCIRQEDDTHVCVPVFEIGHACTAASQCPGYADCVDHVCVELGHTGDSCGLGDCVFPLSCIDGTCQARPIVPAPMCPL
jgi:hypothetical protein